MRKLLFSLMLILLAVIIPCSWTLSKEQIITNGKREVSHMEALQLIKESIAKDKWFHIFGASSIYTIGDNDVMVIANGDTTIAFSLKKGKPDTTKDSWHDSDEEEDPREYSLKRAREYEEDGYWYEAACYYQEVGESDKMLEMTEKAIEQGIVMNDWGSVGYIYEEFLNDHATALEYYRKQLEMVTKAGLDWSIDKYKEAVARMESLL